MNLSFTELVGEWERTLPSSSFSDLLLYAKNLEEASDRADPVEMEAIKGLILARAEELGQKEVQNHVFRAFSKAEKQKKAQAAKETALLDADRMPVPVELDGKGIPLATIDNIVRIMQFDPHYKDIHYNVVLNAAEVHSIRLGKVTVRRWEDADVAESQNYIESTYKIFNQQKHAAALRIFFRSRAYNPILDIVDALEWDGVERCASFLTTWTKCDDTPYTREVSRLIFAGGIHRLYHPGCKFDDVPVLIGTKQGEGKSSLVRWLAIHDSFFSEVSVMDGKEGIEQLEGAWICEIAELLALHKTKDQEAVKSYITRQKDKYRRAYGENVEELPRRCIFIGTTNNRQFLKDKTGNRRFYPVETHCNGYDLYDREQACRDYILQCWAEARDKMRAGTMPPFADRGLVDDYRAAQEEAMEDDWRVGAIEKYLSTKPVGSAVCAREIMRNALAERVDFPRDPTKKESHEIGTIMQQFTDWERRGLHYFQDHGRQRAWVKVSGNTGGIDELPF